MDNTGELLSKRGVPVSRKYFEIEDENVEVPIFTKINLKPWKGGKFYLYIIPEEGQGTFVYKTWVFREGYGVALSSFGAPKEDPKMASLENIKGLDDEGFFDLTKDELYKMP